MIRIVLSFENPDEALDALDHIADEDAPVFLENDGSSFVEVDGQEFPLWDSTNMAADAIRRQIEKEAAE